MLYRVKVHPDAKADRLEARGKDSFELWVRAPAENGRANAAVLSLLAAHLKVEAKRLRVMKGAKSPSKLVQLLGG